MLSMISVAGEGEGEGEGEDLTEAWGASVRAGSGDATEADALDCVDFVGAKGEGEAVGSIDLGGVAAGGAASVSSGVTVGASGVTVGAGGVAAEAAGSVLGDDDALGLCGSPSFPPRKRANEAAIAPRVTRPPTPPSTAELRAGPRVPPRERIPATLESVVPSCDAGIAGIAAAFCTSLTSAGSAAFVRMCCGSGCLRSVGTFSSSGSV